MSWAIKIENLSKLYRIGATEKVGNNLREDMGKFLTGLFTNKGSTFSHESKNLPVPTDTPKDHFWALKDINLEIAQGDVVGIIGRNGAGKSTLLKILSRITQPTTGKIQYRGKVASLLEVGTGFHRELSGRENIYLNGSILGMRRAEITKKLDEIVSFAEIEKFIDTPVKYYSSGMYVRLAFAVAANLESDILVLDEVLAVGDAEFQRKCLGKMGEVAHSGRTVALVSHNLDLLKKTCDDFILLENGKIKNRSRDFMNITADKNAQLENLSIEISKNHSLNNLLVYNRIYIENKDHEELSANDHITNDQDYFLCVQIDVKEVSNNLLIGFDIADTSGTTILKTFHLDSSPERWPKLKLGDNILKCRIPANLLNANTYYAYLETGLYLQQLSFSKSINPHYITLKIEKGIYDSPYYTNGRDGYMASILDWKVEYV